LLRIAAISAATPLRSTSIPTQPKVLELDYGHRGIVMNLVTWLSNARRVGIFGDTDLSDQLFSPSIVTADSKLGQS
jgi:hypothetical protein